MSSEQARDLIAEYRLVPGWIEEAVAAVPPERLNDAKGDDWSPLEVLHHVADFEVINGGRLRLILSRDGAPIASVRQLDLQKATLATARSAARSLALLRAHVEATAELLDSLRDDVWQRAGEHEEYGRYPITDSIRYRIDHARSHSEQIRGSAK